MELFQILDCSTLGTCCSDYGLAVVLDITRRIFDLIQLIVPIVLIAAGTVQFVQLTVNPELKDGFRKVLNKIIAAVIIFLLPTLVNVVFEVAMPDTITVAACWQQAKIVNEINRVSGGSYIPGENEGLSLLFVDPAGYNGGSTNRVNNVETGNGQGSQMGLAIVNYANQFVGKPYLFGGRWNGELPYTPTDCSGFVSGVYKHFGFSLYPQTEVMWNDRSKYTLVTSGPVKAGDLVMYNGHVAMLTGNGNEIIHAKCTRCGIVKDSNYSRSSSFRGIMRINGVN